MDENKVGKLEWGSTSTVTIHTFSRKTIHKPSIHYRWARIVRVTGPDAGTVAVAAAVAC